MKPERRLTRAEEIALFQSVDVEVTHAMLDTYKELDRERLTATRRALLLQRVEDLRQGRRTLDLAIVHAALADHMTLDWKMPHAN